MLKDTVPVLHVSNAAAARAFYRDLLGFELTFSVPVEGSDPCYMGVERDDARLHLSSHAGDGAPGAAVYIYVDDVDALHREFSARGTPIHLAPVDQTWGLREMYVRDPDGNSIRFGTPIG